MHAIVAPGAIDGRLRVDSEEAELVQLRQLLRDDRRLARRRRVGPRERRELPQTELGEERADLVDGRRGVPELERVLLRLLDPDAVPVELAVRGRARVSETAVRVLVPVLCAGEVGPRAVRPEDRADVLCTAVGGKRLHEAGSVSDRRCV